MLNSYMTVEQANAYHDIRMSREAWNALSDQEKQQRLVSASDFLDFNYRFSGEKADLLKSVNFHARVLKLSVFLKPCNLRYVSWHCKIT